MFKFLLTLVSVIILLFTGFDSFGQIPLKPLLEQFTSSTCAPCYEVNKILDPFLESNKQTHSLIKYQVNWPLAGDPYYIEQTNVRIDYYDVLGAPTLYLNGDIQSSLTDAIYEASLLGMTFMEIDITNAEIDEDNMVNVSVNFNALADYPAGLKAHIAIVEKRTFNNVMGNMETEFAHVLMHMLPGPDGTSLPEMTNGQTETITATYDMNNTFMEEANDLSVVVFVQDDSDKSIIQSENADIEGLFELYTVTFDVKDTDGNALEGAEIFLSNHGNLISNNVGQAIYTDALSATMEYRVKYPGALEVIGAIDLMDMDVNENVIINLPDLLVFEEFLTGIPPDWTFHDEAELDQIYWFVDKIVFLRASGTLDPLILVSPPLDLNSNIDGQIQFRWKWDIAPVIAGFGIITDPLDPSSIVELQSFDLTGEYVDYTYDLDQLVNSTDSIHLYWGHNSSELSAIFLQQVIITQGITTAVEDQALKNARIYPNPAIDHVTVEMESMKSIKVYNQLGHLIDNIIVNADKYEMDTSYYSIGSYWFLIESDYGSVMNSFIIAK